MAIAVDFSGARPTIAQLKAAGVAIVIRYLTGSGGKAITKAELDSYAAAGIVVVFVFEITATDAQGGSAAGAANARSALAALARLGITGCPVYFAVDQSIAPANAAPYFQGICSVIQPALVGIYGEGALCTLLQSEGLATWFWQSESTSFPGNATTLAITHLQQKFNASPVADTDLDLILKADVGQYPRPGGAQPAPAPHAPAPPPPTPANPTNAPGDIFAMLASDPSFAVRFLYLSFLLREPDAAGFAADVAYLNGGGTLNQVLANIQDSPEGVAVLNARRVAAGLAKLP